jgi:hypothetical protein
MSETTAAPQRPRMRGWIAAIGLLAVLPLIVFSLLAGRSLLQQQKTAFHVELQQLADFCARELAREVRLMFATLDSLATSDAALSGDYATLHAHARRVVALSPRIGGISAFSAEGVALFTTLVPYPVELPFIPLNDTDKKVVATGLRQVSPLHVAPLSGKKQVLFMVPIKKEGKVAVVLRASMWTEAIAEVLHDQPVPSTWIASVTDQNMTQIGRSHDSAAFVGLTAPEYIQSAVRARLKTPHVTVSPDGATTTTSVAQVAGTQWSVAVAAPPTSIQSNVWRAFQETLWIGLVCVLLSAIGAWLLVRALRKHMKDASDAVAAAQSRAARSLT